MKKLIVLILAVATVLVFAACGGDKNDNNEPTDPGQTTTTTTQEYSYHDMFSISYPDSFTYDDTWEKIKNEDLGVDVSLESFSTTISEWKTTFEGESYTSCDNYTLEETTINGYDAVICTYQDSIGYYKRIEIDISGNSFSYDPSAASAQIMVTADDNESLSNQEVTDVINTFKVNE